MSFHTLPSLYQSQKCFVTYGQMGHVDAQQLPTRGKPWTSIAAQGFIHKIDLIVPQSSFQVLHDKLFQDRPQPHFFRVKMALVDVLSGEFFTQYIKTGTAPLSGKSDVDNTFTLHEGVLNMYLDKETYERAGLPGKPQGPKGSRGEKPRWVVTYNLRSPSMLHGKKGFDRLVYSCKNVFDKQQTWLFFNVAKSAPNPDPLLNFLPQQCIPRTRQSKDLEVEYAPLALPRQVLKNLDRTSLEEVATDIYEWLSLIRLDSPRVEVHDKIDPYLSQYSAPGSRMPSKDDSTKDSSFLDMALSLCDELLEDGIKEQR
ncbi:hypothetical protein S40285_03779 [Stachybotrys chlorohalonatus IBT 40285]|uniref:Uncharacterized protein n=1 Tax=Stachybotrys chlorohalonatus (strain IBT 40285) TaxID=1283841 RepID=A0A084QIY3_STAC4|nr:hypothetical protein S40285_03779 [Stachybotrys chlorohalonata IBT 40285]